MLTEYGMSDLPTVTREAAAELTDDDLRQLTIMYREDQKSVANVCANLLVLGCTGVAIEHSREFKRLGDGFNILMDEQRVRRFAEKAVERAEAGLAEMEAFDPAPEGIADDSIAAIRAEGGA